ncbi:unnamed protein product [Prunus brigantina]
MSAEPRPTILLPLKLLRATLLKSDFRILKSLKIVVQVALSLLVPLREESVDDTYRQLAANLRLDLVRHDLPRLPLHRAMGTHDVTNVVGQGAMQLRPRCSLMSLVVSDVHTTVGHPGDLRRLQLPTRPRVFLLAAKKYDINN